MGKNLNEKWHIFTILKSLLACWKARLSLIPATEVRQDRPDRRCVYVSMSTEQWNNPWLGRPAWNDAEELNRLFSIVKMCHCAYIHLSLVRPHLDYAASIWSPYTNKDKTLLENVQKFALRMATRCWDSSYQDLLELVNLPTLEQRRLEARLCLLYRIIHNLCYFDNSVFALSTFCSHRRFHPLFLKHAHPFAHTNSYFYSFVPHTITLWNSLNTTTVTAPSLATFRNSLNYSLYL